jgi:hypothetical protein
MAGSFFGPMADGAMGAIMQQVATDPESLLGLGAGAGGGKGSGAGSGKDAKAKKRKARNARMQEFIGSVSKDIERQDGESHAEAFKRTSFNQSATGGNQDWMESSEEIRKRMQKTEIAAKAYQKQQDAAAAGGAVEGGQGLKQSKEASKTASAAAQSEFTSQKTQEQRALSGFGESATSGGAGSATIIVKLAGPVEAQLADVAGLSVSLQNA